MIRYFQKRFAGSINPLLCAAAVLLVLLLSAGCTTTRIIDPDAVSSSAVATEKRGDRDDDPAPEYPGKEDGELFLWEFSKDGRTLHILGSIHLASDMIYPLPEQILEAFSVSDILVEEVDIVQADMQEAQEFISSHSTLPDDRVLSEYLGQQEEEMLLEILERYGIPYSTVERLQPWVVSNTLSMLSSFEVDMKPEYGLDLYFAREAQSTGKEVYALETVTQQLEILNSVGLQAQAYSLNETIREFARLDEYMYRVLETWSRGDARAMEEILLEGMTSNENGRDYYRRLIVERNEDWTEQLITLFEREPESRIFAVVGSAHLLGPHSLVRLLMEEGFQARRY
ncbi:TraB/GumN family protein [Salinispira pacifica]|uniref:Lipoprotein n=1 Tax=Salinispira pacifica TaxID=1307761 RepID=V5WJN9_9SPIO|nr:TraB/GumN family protein [Salinispira pacifica]AHC15789.1 hypothetical protein L21SP2_2436 [Salinispira pacifica]